MLFGLADLVGFVGVSFDDLVELRARPGVLRLPRFAYRRSACAFDERVAADIAHSDFRIFNLRMDQFDELLAPFFGQRRDIDANLLSVIVGLHAEIGFENRFFDQSKGAAVLRLDDEQAGFRRGDAGELN